MNIQGKIKEIYDVQQVSDKFRKREFVIEYADNPMYPQYVKFELTQDKCDLLDNFKVGADVDVHFNIRGRSWVNKQGETMYFNSLQAWKLDEPSEGGAPAGGAGGGFESQPKAQATQNAPAQPGWLTADDQNKSFSIDEEDDLPF